jgi:hypothetical protein
MIPSTHDFTSNTSITGAVYTTVVFYPSTSSTSSLNLHLSHTLFTPGILDIVGAKRSRDEALAEEVTTSYGNPTMRGAQQLPASNTDKDDKRRTKKSKTSLPETQDEVEQPSQSLQGVSVSAVVPSAVAEDQEMSDASTDSDKELKVKVPPTPTTTDE